MHISQWNMWSLIHSEAFFIRYIFEQLVFLKPRHELIGLYSWIWSKISRCNFFSRILILDHFRRKNAILSLFLFWHIQCCVSLQNVTWFLCGEDGVSVWAYSSKIHIQVSGFKSRWRNEVFIFSILHTWAFATNMPKILPFFKCLIFGLI